MTTHVSILLFEGCDLLDSGGPYEVFLTASRMAERNGGPGAFEIDMVTVEDQPVKAYGGLGLIPTAPADVLATTDVVIVPGAIDLTTPLADAEFLDAVRSATQRDDATVASVCTGAFFLGEVGALADTSWTTHWEDIDILGDKLGADGATTGVRWVDNGTIVTGGALSSGIAMSLHLVARFASPELAERTAKQLDYEWNNQSVVNPEG